MKVSVVTDSTCDLPANLVEQYQISVVPNILVLDGKGYEDGTEITRKEFYDRLPGLAEFPTTATASSGAYQSLYERLLQEGAHQILSIHAASALSGIVNAAQTAAQSFQERVKVIDSFQVSLGMGFQVLAAAEAAVRGLPVEKILELLSDLRRRLRLVAMLDTLEYVRRSGRVSWARARLVDLLGIRPLIELKDGRVLSVGETRTRRKGIERLLGFIKDLAPLERLAILHSNAEDDAQEFLDRARSGFSTHLPIEPLVVNVTTIIGTHVGPNGLGFVAISQQ